METFITDVSTTRTNIAAASRIASLRSALASPGALVPASLVIAAGRPWPCARQGSDWSSSGQPSAYLPAKLISHRARRRRGGHHPAQGDLVADQAGSWSRRQRAGTAEAEEHAGQDGEGREEPKRRDGARAGQCDGGQRGDGDQPVEQPGAVHPE